MNEHEALIASIEAMRAIKVGCGNAYCDLKGTATGMHTNGGCNCLHDLRPPLRWKIQAVLHAAHRYVESQRATTKVIDLMEEFKKSLAATAARQARIDARTLELIEEATAVDSGNTVGVHVRAALTEARRIATEEADAGVTP